MTHRPAAVHLRSARPFSARPDLLRRLARAVRRLYADRPLASLGSPGYAGELPSQRYAELASLDRTR